MKTIWPTTCWLFAGWLTDISISWRDGQMHWLTDFLTDWLTDCLNDWGIRVLIIRVPFSLLQAWPKERNDHRRRNLQRSTPRPPSDSFWLPFLKHFLQGYYPRSPCQQHPSQVLLHRLFRRFLWHRRNHRWLLSQAPFLRFLPNRPLPVCQRWNWTL